MSAATAPDGPEAQAKESLGVLLATVPLNGGVAAAPLIAYRGPDSARNYADVCDYANEGDQTRVDSVMKRLKVLLDAGAPHFDRSETKRQKEGVWTAWHVTFGEGAKAKKAVLACLPIKGVMALGDID